MKGTVIPQERQFGLGRWSKEKEEIEVFMVAYLLLLVAVLTRVLPHAGWWNFTAVGGALLYFGARRSRREMLVPMAALMATDYYLTVYAYHFPFRFDGYAVTWSWYLGAMVLGLILLKTRTTFARVGAGVVLGPTSFFVVSNYAVWAGSGMYPRTWAGLSACYVAGLPFYRNDLASAAVVAGLAFGVPVLVRRMQGAPVVAAAVAGK
ncbi:MAG: DUF6580 family putative transport protein [Terracidiphilus sp.]|jgi:hypothetical protein